MKTKSGKIIFLIKKIILILFITLSIYNFWYLFNYQFLKKDYISVFGFNAIIIDNNILKPSVKKGDLIIFINRVYSDLKPGDFILFKEKNLGFGSIENIDKEKILIKEPNSIYYKEIEANNVLTNKICNIPILGYLFLLAQNYVFTFFILLGAGFVIKTEIYKEKMHEKRMRKKNKREYMIKR